MCPKHKDYKVIRAPTGDCKACWKLWAEKDTVQKDRNRFREERERKHDKKKYRDLTDEVERLERELEASRQLGDHFQTYNIQPKERTKTSEATAVIVASDWHYEQRVTRRSVNGLNAYSLKIARWRIERFWQGALRLYQISAQDVKISQLVLALLGDFINGSIHESLLEVNQLRPMEAVIEVQEHIASGIRFLLEKTRCDLVVVCNAGNHSRITAKPRYDTENGNSLEWLMYFNLANQFKNEKRIKFVISGGYHNYLNIYGRQVRFHHGHAILYKGGVGGLSVPALRKIGQWANLPNKVDLDICGHHHIFCDFGRLLVNGCLVGYTPYALRGAFPYETPRQAFVLLDKRRWKTIVAPILTEV